MATGIPTTCLYNLVPNQMKVLTNKYVSVSHLIKVTSSDTEVPFLDLDLSITNGIVSTKIYPGRFNFEKVYFPFLDIYVPCSPSYGVYISQLICFARV